MSFTEAIQTCFSKIITIDGRASRSEYWYFWLFTAIIGAICNFVFKENSTIPAIVSGILSLCTLTVSIRRLHDTGRSGWWLLLDLTVIGAIVPFIFFLMDSQPGTNKYGPNPKGIQGPAY